MNLVISECNVHVSKDEEIKLSVFGVISSFAVILLSQLFSLSTQSEFGLNILHLHKKLLKKQ